MQADVPQIDNIENLQRDVAARYDLFNIGEWTRIVNGDECFVWKVERGDSPLIVRLSPAWRTPEELRWVHALTVHCGKFIPEVVAPMIATENTTLFTHAGYPVTVFPFVEGEALNTADDNLNIQAARLLARMHRVMANSPEQSPRPKSKTTRPQPLPKDQHPRVLQDAAFDAWVDSLPDSGLTVAPIHGDYYSRNLLVADGKITGVIDWDEADIKYLMAEVGWSAWEFTQNDAGDDLVYDRARDFLDAYFESDPPCPRSEIEHAINFMRLRLRDEAVADLGRKARGEHWDKDYTEAEMRAFVALKGQTL